jgi:SSS family solute:Na+ symporter
VSRWATVGLFVMSIFVTMAIDTVGAMWELLLALGSGTGLVLILRWYWWRINAWSEISAMIASFVVSMVAMWQVKAALPKDSPLVQTYVMLITVVISTIVWLSVTYMTKPEPDQKLEAFYQKVRPGGPGWRRISEQLGYGGETIPGGALAWTNWLAGIIAVYSSLFGIGKLIFGETMTGIIMLIVAALAFAWIARAFREEDAGPRAQRDVIKMAAD